MTYIANCENGVFCYKRLVNVERRLKGHPAAQCGIIHADDDKRTILFVSYETIVCEIDKDGFFHLNGIFSRTTSKQISWFLSEWCHDYSHRRDLCDYTFLRKQWEKGLDVNLWNGDTRKAINGMVLTIGTRY